MDLAKSERARADEQAQAIANAELAVANEDEAITNLILETPREAEAVAAEFAPGLFFWPVVSPDGLMVAHGSQSGIVQIARAYFRLDAPQGDG